MSVTIHCVALGVRAPVSQRRLRALATAAAKDVHCTRHVQISIAFVTRRESQRLNHLYRGKKTPANVLSVPLDNTQKYVSGEVILCPTVARAKPILPGESFEYTICRLFLHGVLHLLGVHHTTTAKRLAMEQREDRLLAAVLPAP